MTNNEEKESAEFEIELVDKILRLVKSEFTDEMDRAVGEYQKTHEKIIEHMSEENARRDFISWFLLEYPLPNGYTPMEFSYVSGKGFFSEEKMMINNFLNHVFSIFEIKAVSLDNKDYTIVNISDNQEYLVKTIDMAFCLKNGDVISARIVRKLDGNYFFYGNVTSYEKKSAEKMKKEYLRNLEKISKNGFDEINALGKTPVKDVGRLLEVQKEMAESFKEYFGSYDVVFESIGEVEMRFNDFFIWRNNEWIVPGKGKTPEQLWLDAGNKGVELKEFKLGKGQFKGMKKFGIVAHPKAGILIIPFYGYVKQLFEGDYKGIPDYHGFLYGIIVGGNLVPPFIIRQFIEKNKDGALMLFKDAYEDVNTIEDVYDILEQSGKDWSDGLSTKTSLFE